MNVRRMISRGGIVFSGTCLLALANASVARAYFDTLPPIRVVVPPNVGGITEPPRTNPPPDGGTPPVEPPVINPPPVIIPPPVVIPPPEVIPPPSVNTPEPATIVMGLSALGLAGAFTRRRK